MVRSPRIPRPEGRPPTRDELLSHLEYLDVVASEFVGRWQDHIPAEVRVELMTRLYEPNLRMLIRARRRPLPR